MQAVQVILTCRERIRTESSNDTNKRVEGTTETELQQVDPIQVSDYIPDFQWSTSLSVVGWNMLKITFVQDSDLFVYEF